MTKNNIISGIVINKIQYNDYHEILTIISEHGIIGSYFYENVNKNKKKVKVILPCKVTVNYFPTTGMNKIINLEVDNYYNEIYNDIVITSYISNILELINYDKENNYYNLLSNILKIYNENTINAQLLLIYFNIKYISMQGYTFKYKKVKNTIYKGYSFEKHMFIDYIDANNFFKINERLINYIYILSIGEINILTKINIEFSDYKLLFEFLNIILCEYVGINPKSYKKILELEEYSQFF